MFVLAVILIFLNFFVSFGRAWLIKNIGLISIDEVIFHLKVPLNGTSNDMIRDVIINVLIVPLIITIIAAVVLKRIHADVHLKLWDKNLIISLRKFLPIAITLVGFFGVASQLQGLARDYKLDEYIAAQTENSTFIEENYVEPFDVELVFPETKRNLLYIYLESMESTYLSKENGGLQEESLMPELESLALKHTNFSHNVYLGGAQQTTSTGWTMAALVAQTAGIPMKLPVDMNYLGDSASSLLKNATTLGMLLDREGYKNVFMAGSDMTFGGRRTYFTQHGNYEVKDIYTAEEDDIIPKDRRVFWGMEDSYLYEYAKKELTELSSSNQPFNLSMLTVNTHFPEGYLEGECRKPYADQYSNTISCASTQLSDFLDWVMEQDFYENTTIVISGDHLTMATNDILGKDEDKYTRTTFNLFINSAITEPSVSVTKGRIFTTLDMFPTTLAAMGVEIPGEHLGLGVNLYSGERTLAEKTGFSVMTDELAKRSDFYTFKFL